MSADATQPDDERTITELRRMPREEAVELSHAEFKKWESVNDKLDEHEETKAKWDETREAATQTLVSADATDFATDVTVFGNDLAVYYASDDPRLREIVERLTDVFDIDAEAAREGEVEDIAAEDVDDDDIDAAKGVLADLVMLAAVAWDGERVDDFDAATRDAYREAIMADRPDGWGLAGLMDAWSEIQYAVESTRDERMERVEKFRDAGRRGDR